MALPKVDVPVYELLLPSTGKKISVRPFIVKEEKLLLMALASKDEDQIIQTTKQIVNNCILTKGINVDKLPFYDIDYLFIALRAKSVGEAIDVKFICNNVVDNQKCSFTFPVQIDVSNVTVTNIDRPKEITLTSGIVVKLKHPSYATMKSILSLRVDNLTKKIKMIAACIDLMIDGDQTYSPKDYSREEFEALIENLTEENFKKLESFVDNLPFFSVSAQHDCPKCGYAHKINYTDFTSFFR